MTRIIWRAGFVCLVLAALAVGAAVLGFLGPRDVDADEGTRVRLLVKCDPEDLTTVLAALATTEAEVWDLGTMKRLTALRKPAEKEPEKPAPARDVPPLRDAGKVMTEVLSAVGSIKPGAGSAAPQVTEMIIQEHRATLKVSATTHADIHAVAKALEGNPWLKGRMERVEHGAVQRTGAGQFLGALSVLFDTTRPEPGTATALRTIDTRVVEAAARTQKMVYQYASSQRIDPNRKAGYVTTAREFVFQTTTLPRLHALVQALPQAQPGLVVFEIRWKDNGAGHLLKPVIRLGGRAPLKR